MDGPNYLRLLQTGALNPNIPEHRKVLEENLGPLAVLMRDLGLEQKAEPLVEEQAEEVAPPVVDLPEPVAAPVEEDAPKKRGRKKKDPELPQTA